MGLSITPEGPPVKHLELDQSSANLLFNTWALQKGVITSETTVSLPGPVYVPDATGSDYLRTRAAALANHLHSQPHGRYAFLLSAGAAGPPTLHEVRLTPHSLAPDFIPICELPLEAGHESSGAAPSPEPPLQPTVVEVARADGAAPALLLASTGAGDLRCIRLAPGEGPAAPSAVLHPLRPAPPLAGVRAFQLLAAAEVPGAAGELRCLAWAVRERAGGRRAAAEVHSLRLGVEGEALALLDSELLLASRLPPHGAAVNAATGSVLVAVDPEGPPRDPAAVPQAPTIGTAAPAPAPAAGGDSAAPAAESDASPRSLAAAVARLEAFTAQEPEGPLPPHRYHDVYAESGPDGAGDLGGEPAVTLHVFTPDGGGGLLRPAESTACQPHRLLSAAALPAAAAGAAPGAGLLLGLTDDVDCAVVAAVPGGGPEGRGFELRHEGSVPALAYVAAGKPQRRHLLLAPPGGDVAAALVESARYAFLYRSTAAKQETGEQEVADLLSPGIAAVLGGALAGGARGACRLLVLGRERLVVYAM